MKLVQNSDIHVNVPYFSWKKCTVFSVGKEWKKESKFKKGKSFNKKRMQYLYNNSTDARFVLLVSMLSFYAIAISW